MSGPRDDEPPPPPDESATVFRPGSTAPPGGASTAVPGRDSPGGASGTEGGAQGAEPTAVPTPTRLGGFEPRAASEGIRVGDVLNHIFEVKRFIARGGMGEVFEGCNVNSEERVAIKVMLPSLAQDPNVIAMFRKEARTLTRLQHEALVQYRVLAQEPQLGVLYIVTEYIDGVTLSGTFGSIHADSETFETLLRRLASGLRAAHALGAIHRDMAPDNVLLEGGRLGAAKIVDFGIAKDLDPGSKTIVGEGFAGKLNYVAPEQLGDFGREIGPWTDVYSLGLVMLAFARGRDVEMGGTLVDAVDKRRAGVDVSAVPERLRPVLEQMLKPNPADRFRSMDEVLAALDRPARNAAPAAAAVRAKPPRRPLAVPKRGLLLAGGGLGAALLVVAAAFFLSRGTGGDETPVEHRKAPVPVAQAPAPPADPVEAARTAIDSALPAVACSWLDITDLRQSGDRLTIRVTGVAGTPLRAQEDISAALAGAGLASVDIDFSEVAQIEPAGCSALDAFRSIRAADGGRLSVPQRTFEIEPLEGQDYTRGSRSIIMIGIGDPAQDVAIAGIDPAGKIDPLILGRSALREAVEGSQITNVGEDRYRLNILQEHTGWSGILLLIGKGPFESSLLAPPRSARDAEWRQRFLDTARRQGWRAEMIWFKSVDERPG
ncbi:MAG TPA: serine/threonine-protein kinase [Allosphingosinicella sp.]